MKRILFSFTFAGALSTCLLFTPGCSRTETPPGTTEPATTNASVQEEFTAPVEMKSVIASEAKSVTPPAEIQKLSPEIATMVMTNIGAPEVRILAIEQMNLTSTEKAQAFLFVLPTLNRDGQRQFAWAAIRHIEDSTHSLIRQPLIEGKMNKQVLSIFMTDTLKRPNRVKIPTLVALAGAADNPMQAEARELLTAFFGKDHGTNLAQWKQNMESWLAMNPN